MPRFLKKQYLNMIWELALAEFRLKDQGSVLGFFWTLLHPLIYFFVLHGLFKKWMGHHVSNFPLYLIIGIVQWNFFATATSNTIMAIMRQADYVKNINFPKEVLVFSSVLAVVFSHMLELLILLIFWFIIGQSLSPVVFLLIPILVLNIYLTVAIGFALATIGVYFLDIQRIWGIFTSVGLFLTPIFYSLNLLSSGKRKIILLNPVTHIITASREVLMNGRIPELTGLLYVVVFASVIMFFGYLSFRKHEGYFVEKI